MEDCAIDVLFISEFHSRGGKHLMPKFKGGEEYKYKSKWGQHHNKCTCICRESQLLRGGGGGGEDPRSPPPPNKSCFSLMHTHVHTCMLTIRISLVLEVSVISIHVHVVCVHVHIVGEV